MREHGILFSAPMVRALLAGTKLQTRRVVKPRGWDPSKKRFVALVDHGENPVGLQAYFDSIEYQGVTCPYGRVGDRLWVRECWSFDNTVRHDFKPIGRHDLSGTDLCTKLWYRADFEQRYGAWECDVEPGRVLRNEGKWKPGIHMFRWMSRIVLEISEVRVQRVKDISEADALAEGVDPYEWTGGPANPHAVGAFRELWERINGKPSWAANPWCWCVSFKRVEEKAEAA